MGFAVTLVEREHFPRQKLCGEFISPECLGHLRDLGVENEIISAGGDRISETVFYAASGKSIVIPSRWLGDRAAVSLSRAEMDMRLLHRAEHLGAEVVTDSSIIALEMAGQNVRSVSVRRGSGDIERIEADVFIDATGRGRILEKLVIKNLGNDKTVRRKPFLIGFKAHLRGARPGRGRCEIYSFSGGYGGLSNIENGLANLCFLIKSETAREYGSDAARRVRDRIETNARARESLLDAEPVHDWLAVAVDRFGINQPSIADNVFAVGDAGAFIDPFTGSGMLMAFESSGLLADCIANEDSVERAKQRYNMTFQRRYSKRFGVGSLVRRIAFAPRAAGAAIALLSASRKASALLARSTRHSRKSA
jgi:flavin-dependent dehydrogenase